jgi:tape measure domain-containing protein
MATVDEIKIIVKAEVDSAIAKLTQLNNVNKENHKTGLDMAKSIAGYTNAYSLAISGAQALIRGTVDLIKNSITLAAGVERVKMEFSVLTGSMERSNKLFAQMNTLAAQTPLELSDITSAGKQLLSVGVPVEDITNKLRMLGDVAMGNPEKLQRLTEAFGQLKSKGVASMEQLNRFIEAGVPIMTELQKQTGKTGDEVFKMVSQGKIGYPEVTKALEALTGAGGLMENMMAKVAETAAGKWSTALDNWKAVLVDIGTKLLPAATAALNQFSTAMSDLSLMGVVKDIMKGTVKDYETVTAAFKRAQEIISNPEESGLGWLNIAILKGQYEELGKLQYKARLAEELRAKAAKGTANVAASNASGAADNARKQAQAEEEASNLLAYQLEKRYSAWEDYFSKLDTKKKESSQTEIGGMSLGNIDEAYLASIENVTNATYDMIPVWQGVGEAISDTSELTREYMRLIGNASGVDVPIVQGVNESVTMFRDLLQAEGDAFSPEIIEMIKAINDAMKKQMSTVEKLSWGWNAAQGAIGAYGDLVKNQGDAEIAMMRKRGATDEEIKAKQNEINEKAFNANKANSIANALINGYEAATKAYAQSGLLGGTVGAAIIAGLTAAQVGMIAAQSYVPMAEGGSGIVTKPTLFLAGEAGPESFSFGGRGSGRGGVTQIFYIGGSVIAERQVMQLGVAGMAMAGRGY